MRKDYERERRLAIDAEVRKRNISDFWLRFSTYFRPWLYELTDKYIENMEMPSYAMWILPSYYAEKDDKEVAAMVAMLVNDEFSVQKRCREIRLAIGAHPWEWFRNRGFVTLSIGSKQQMLTGGIRNWRIAEAMDVLWEGRRREGRWVIEQSGADDTHVRMAKMVLSYPGNIPCPITKEVRSLLKTFSPDYMRLGADDAVRLFGFERDCDVFYAALAWKDYQRRKPKESSRLVTLYNRRYKDSNILVGKYWYGRRRGILPEI